MLIRQLIAVATTWLLAAASAATPITMVVTLTPDLEAPPVLSDALGVATLSFDPNLISDGLDYTIVLESIDSTVGLAGLYAGQAGATGPLLTELFDFSGLGIPGADLTISGTVMLDQATIDAMMSGAAYVNVDSEEFPGGELRGDVGTVPVPEPATATLLGLALVALAAGHRTRR